ncbi:hypothetical protein F511_04774 [Dorcoceras hygrometricum]|uniref:Uncharacterized protein n=1 Tax=Dorcoceras hygrometricum TaxID=472368 RepID=A0A2Z7AW51_9LAMI|nr:hypothetical protein F511_04774 [Dorcoceras hygrometricum]
MGKGWEDSSPGSTIETEHADEVRTMDYMVIESMHIDQEETVDITRDFLKLVDKRTHSPTSTFAVYEKDHDTMNMVESLGSSGSRSNEADLITRDFLKLIDGNEEDLGILKMGGRGMKSNAVSYEEDVRTKDYLKLMNKKRKRY